MIKRAPQPSGMFVMWILILTGVFGLLVLFEPFELSYDIEWGDIHFALGITLVGSMLIHFIAKRRACKANIMLET